MDKNGSNTRLGLLYSPTVLVALLFLNSRGLFFCVCMFAFLKTQIFVLKSPKRAKSIVT